MKVTTTKRNALLGAIVAAGLIVVVMILRDKFLDSDKLEQGALILGLTVLACVGVGLAAALRFEFSENNKWLRNVLMIVWFFGSPIISIQMYEVFDVKFIWDLTTKNFIANYICYLVFLLAVYAISGSFKISLYVPMAIVYAFALLNDILQTFRGSPFVPADFVSARTGMNVVGNYDPFFDFAMLFGSIMFVFFYFITRKIPKLTFDLRGKLVTRLTAAAYVVVILCLFYQTNVVPDAGIKPDFWNQTRGYHKSGTFLNFMLNTKYLFVGEPDGYNPDDIPQLVDELASKSDYEPEVTYKKDMPHIIFIMNESYSDLTVDGSFETNTGYMDYFDSLTENTVKGNVYVPVNGAGTSNSEFEALTGLSLSFLPSGSNVYDSYLKHEVPSLVSTLSDLGYLKTALHPYYRNGWSREGVYPLLGFDKFISIEDILGEEIVDAYVDSDSNIRLLERLLAKEFPGEDILVRRYISDAYNYKVLEENFEQRDEDAPYFVFNVTMQNHGGYTLQYDNFDEEVQITNMSKTYKLANQYLSLIKASDEALEQIIDYFKDVEQPTIICMFGDHQPYVETAFFEELFGTSVSSLSMEQLQQRYITPFLIWANYDIEEKVIPQISCNYLSTLLLETAGLPMTEFNKYLQQLYKEIPVIDTVGYIASDGNYYSYTDQTEYTQLLKDYEKIEYNSLFDTENRQESVFYLQQEGNEKQETE